MNILFIGKVEFSYLSLKKLIELHANIVGVCTSNSSSFNSDYADLSKLCMDNAIPYLNVCDINSDKNFQWIKDKKPDVIFCFGWSSLIKQRLLNFPKLGVVGFHPTELPKNRGRHPIIWALFLGLEKTASTFFFMDEGADSGDVLSQKTVKISTADNAKTLYEKISLIALEQIEEFLPKLSNGLYDKVSQNHVQASVWRKRNKFDGEIDFRMSSKAIYNLVRALTFPYAGAHITINGNDIKVWEVEIDYNNSYGSNIEPGKILKTIGKSITVKTYDGSIILTKHDFVDLPTEGDYL